jgi:hypothetical protein
MLPSLRIHKRALRFTLKLLRRYGTDISLKVSVSPEMKVNHYVEIIVRAKTVIGRSLKLRENMAVG